MPFHRLTVGNRTRFDVMGGLQLALLLALGLREDHRVCDVGCGSLRAGRLLIPYLAPGNYFGIEPRRDVVEAGIEHEIGHELVRMRRPQFDHGDDFGLERFRVRFDYVLAQSIFSHSYRDLTELGLRNISGALAPDGLFVGTFYEHAPLLLPVGPADLPDAATGWRYPGTVAYTWREWRALAHDAGLTVRRFRWAHLRQTWFVAAPAGQDARLRAATSGALTRLRGPGMLGHARRRAWARVAREGRTT